MTQQRIYQSVLAKWMYRLGPGHSYTAWIIFLYDTHYKLIHPKSKFGIFGRTQKIHQHKFFPAFVRFGLFCRIDKIDPRVYFNALAFNKKEWRRQFPLPNMLLSNRAVDSYLTYLKVMVERYPTAKKRAWIIEEIPTTNRKQKLAPKHKVKHASKSTIQVELGRCLEFLRQQIDTDAFDAAETLVFDWNYLSPFVVYFIPSWRKISKVPAWKQVFVSLDSNKSLRHKICRMIRKWFESSQAYCWDTKTLMIFDTLFHSSTHGKM